MFYYLPNNSYYTVNDKLVGSENVYMIPWYLILVYISSLTIRTG